ncbi:hypothetical protein CA606_18525 [Caulobacter vibrioides]|uniref:Uncharacterized protein n=1 Tax=Caulobacter vibrioides TaxID=155892 RepID=A0A290MQX6_CAUVI|nr:hypothetical protein [Caulobacter vibrioides]ATC34166.1 hypothetical protein CA606_18525 [Caulobacter vibrioides]
MTKIAKSAEAEHEAAPEAEGKSQAFPNVPAPTVGVAPAAAHAVLLRATNGVRRGGVVRGAPTAISALIARQDARAATETDIAIAGRVIDL